MDKTLNFFITPPLIPPLKMGEKQLIKTNFHYSFKVRPVTKISFPKINIIYFNLIFPLFVICDIYEVAYSVGILKLAEVENLFVIRKVIFYIIVDFTVKQKLDHGIDNKTLISLGAILI